LQRAATFQDVNAGAARAAEADGGAGENTYEFCNGTYDLKEIIVSRYILDK